MKKLYLILAIILVMNLMQVTAFADCGTLSIDNQNKYEGMSKSYADGYKPSIENGKAVIVLPLVNHSSEVVENNQITATLDLGSTSNSPFVYANYQKNVNLKDNSIGNSTVSSYLIKFEIPLSSNRYMGTYPVIVNVDYSTDVTPNQSQSFTVYVTTDGKDPNATPPPVEEPEQPAPRPQPKIIVSKYTVNKDVVMAGEEFDIDVTLLNTEDHWHTKNIVVTYAGETVDIMPNAETNTFYIEEIEDQETYNLDLKLKTRLDAEPRPQKVIINIQYEDSARSSYTVTEEILIELQQPIRFEHDEVNIPKTVNAGDSLPISMQLFNMGKSTLYNVMVSLEMTGVIPDGSAYLGNMDSGTSGNAEIYAFFGTLDMGENASNKEEKYGLSTGIMTITYEDEYGKKYSETIDVQTNIERPMFDEIYQQEEEVQEEPEKMSSWWISIGLLLGIAMIILGITGYRRKINQLRREYGDSRRH